MTFRQLKDLVASWLDDLQFGYFTEPQVEVFINNATKEVQKRLIKAGQNYYNIPVQTTLVVNQNDYVLPDDFKKLHRLEVVISGSCPNESVQEILPITTNQQDLVPTGVGTPLCYYFKKSRLVLKPAPDTALTMRMIYSYLVQDMTLDTDTPDVPESYHELIALLAAQDGFIKDGRSSPLLEKKLKQFEDDMDSDAQERNQDSPRSIVQTTNDYSGAFY